MSRQRSTWKNRQADPYTMHQERNQPSGEDYLIGDSSAFGEGVHQELPDDEATGRNEVGLPNPAPTSTQEYANEHTISAEDADGKGSTDVPISEMNDRKVASREVMAALKKKARSCIIIAKALLPGAPESLVEDQAYDLMSMPDAYIVSTLERIAASAEDEAKKEDEEEETKEAAKKSEKEEDDDKEDDEKEDADEDDKDDKEDDKDEEACKDKKASDAQVQAMFEEIVSEATDADEDIDAMLDDMTSEAALVDDSYQVTLEPTMDLVATEDLSIDSELAHLFDHTIDAGAQTVVAGVQNTTQGVSTLGGRVRSAASTEDDFDLSKLWKSDPDITGAF